MELPNPKELKRLAEMCRKAGIKHFKSGDIEFTLNDEVPLSNYKKNKVTANTQSSDPSAEFQSDTLTDDEILFWSTGNAADSLTNESND